MGDAVTAVLPGGQCPRCGTSGRRSPGRRPPRGVVPAATLVPVTITALAVATGRYGIEAGLVGLAFATTALVLATLCLLVGPLLTGSHRVGSESGAAPGPARGVPRRERGRRSGGAPSRQSVRR